MEVYVFAQGAGGATDVKLLQLRRAVRPMAGTWQPVMGHIEAGETAVQAGLRELREETGLSPMTLDDGRALWQLEAVNTFFMASLNAIIMAPALAVQVPPDAQVTLDDTHDQLRWIRAHEADTSFFWPGQRTAVAQLLTQILPQDGSLRQALRLRMD
jgi:dATP pyrophosphohydrolase